MNRESLHLRAVFAIALFAIGAASTAAAQTGVGSVARIAAVAIDPRLQPASHNEYTRAVHAEAPPLLIAQTVTFPPL